MDPLQALTLTKLQLARSQPQAPNNARRPRRQSSRPWHQRFASTRQALTGACGLVRPQGHTSLRRSEPTLLPTTGRRVTSAAERD